MEFILYNNKIVYTNRAIFSNEVGLAVYEVLRLMDGIPLFFEDHMKRLERSLALVGHTFEMNPDQLMRQFSDLAVKNKRFEGNIMLKISILDNRTDLMAGFIPHAYPSKWDYKNGVKVEILEAERENPEAKVANTSVRERANKLLAETGCYEVLLVDHRGFIREGSRSNVLAIRNMELFTAPLDSVLNGITLLKVLLLAEKLSIPVNFECPALGNLASYDAFFLTGTSPKILPIQQIENQIYNVEDKLMRKLMDAYDLLIQTYIQK